MAKNIGDWCERQEVIFGDVADRGKVLGELGVGGRMGNKNKLEGKWKCGEIGSEVVRIYRGPGNGFAEMAEGMQRWHSTPEIGFGTETEMGFRIMECGSCYFGVEPVRESGRKDFRKCGKLCGKCGNLFRKGVLGFRKLEWGVRGEYKAGEGHEIVRDLGGAGKMMQSCGNWVGDCLKASELARDNVELPKFLGGGVEQNFGCYEHSEKESGDSEYGIQMGAGTVLCLWPEKGATNRSTINGLFCRVSGIQVPVNISGPAESDKKLFGESMWVKKAQASTELGAEVMQQ
ncbi:hypothetical protein JOM56_013118 [Amanita muscaria]